MMPATPKKQRGIALITVLMILSIMVTIAATMTGRLTLSLKRTEGLIFAQSAYWYAQAAGDFGRMILNQDIADSEVISLDQNWALPEMVFPLENGMIAGEFKDMRSCFNLNAVGAKDEGSIRATEVVQFEALLVEIGVNEYAAEMIAESTRDWIDSSDKSNGSQGAEDSFYQARSVPHLAANNLMVEVSELRAVQGVGQQVYQRIAPYLCAIPSTTQKINVNTVAEDQHAIIYALFKRDFDLSISDFKSLLESRPKSGWNSVDDFLSSSMFTGLKVSDEIKKQLSVSSEFFQLNGGAEFEDRITAVQLLFEVDNKKAKVIRYQSGGLK